MQMVQFFKTSQSKIVDIYDKSTETSYHFCVQFVSTFFRYLYESKYTLSNSLAMYSVFVLDIKKCWILFYGISTTQYVNKGDQSVYSRYVGIYQWHNRSVYILVYSLVIV